MRRARYVLDDRTKIDSRVNMIKNIPEDTITAISTPIGEGGICIVRLSGPEAISITDSVFEAKDKKGLLQAKTHTLKYGHIIEKNSPDKDVVIDEVLITIMRAPRSYTREDVVEINCHGGIQSAKRVFELVARSGARIAEPGEFTKRAFLNGRIDLIQAEAVLDVIRAKTEGSLKVAMSQLDGELSVKVNGLIESILDIASQIEASIDFPEEELDIQAESSIKGKICSALKELESLVDTYDAGMVLREGVLAIICGKPNTGKSSLMNLLLKRDRVIVSEIPGTTRDTVEELINLKGLPVRIVDTAGISETKDLVEREGVKRSKKYIKLSDFAIFMLDASSGIDRRDMDIMKLLNGKKKIILVNKSDIAKKKYLAKIRETFKGEKVIEVSVKNKKNIGKLEKAMLDIVWSGDYSQGEGAIVANARHKELLDKALANMLSVNEALSKKAHPELISIDLKEALFNLGLIVGKSVTDKILDNIFEQFCIGK